MVLIPNAGRGISCATAIFFVVNKDVTIDVKLKVDDLDNTFQVNAFTKKVQESYIPAPFIIIYSSLPR